MQVVDMTVYEYRKQFDGSRGQMIKVHVFQPKGSLVRDPHEVTTMTPHMVPVLVCYRKWTRV